MAGAADGDVVDPIEAALERMAAAVRKGEFDEARAIGSHPSLPVPLVVASTCLEVGEQVSEGSEGTVHRGQLSGTPVAVKRPRISRTADLERFRNELRALSKLNHPGVVKLLTAHVVPPSYCMVLPWYRTSLERELHVSGWRPGWRQVALLGAQLASAVAHVHAHGFIHRDIKPGNVLLDEGRANAVLTDFGLALPTVHECLQLGAHEQATAVVRRRPTGGFHKAQVVGTLEYMAPELLKKAPAGTTSDVWALGVCLNELATGVMPYSDCTRDNPRAHTILEMGYGRQELTSAICAEGLRPLMRDDTPPRFQKLLEACWQLEPSDRPSAAVVESELLSLLQEIGDEDVDMVVDEGADRAASGAVDKVPGATEGPREVKGEEAVGRDGVAASAGGARNMAGPLDTAPAAPEGMLGAANVNAADDTGTSGQRENSGLANGKQRQGEEQQQAANTGASAPDEDQAGQSKSSWAAEEAVTSADTWCAPQWATEAAALDGYQPTVSAAAFATPGRRGPDKMEDFYVIRSPVFTPPGASASSPPPGESFGAVPGNHGMKDDSPLPLLPQAHLVGVFDGHRGAAMARFAAEHLAAALAAVWGQAAGPGEALAAAFVALDRDFSRYQEAAWAERQQRMGAASGRRGYPGATAIAALVWGGNLYVANAGDCRAVLCRGGQAQLEPGTPLR